MLIFFFSLLLQVFHPILDQHFFLDTSHKTRLKEEYGEFTKFCLSLVLVDKLTEISFYRILLLGIEPWTFEQHVGEAVIIPAGCPYQIRNVKVMITTDIFCLESLLKN